MIKALWTETELRKEKLERTSKEKKLL